MNLRKSPVRCDWCQLLKRHIIALGVTATLCYAMDYPDKQKRIHMYGGKDVSEALTYMCTDLNITLTFEDDEGDVSKKNNMLGSTKSMSISPCLTSSQFNGMDELI